MSAGREVTIERHTPPLDPFRRRGVVWYVLAFRDGTYHRSDSPPVRNVGDATIWQTRAKAAKGAEINGYRVR